MAGNKNSGRRPGGRDFTPRLRSLIDRVLQNWDNSGKAEKALNAALEEDFVGTLQRLSAYAPKQVDMAVEQSLSIDTTQLSAEALQVIFAERERRESDSDKSIH